MNFKNINLNRINVLDWIKNLETVGFTNETKEDYKICNITILKSWISEKYSLKF